MKVTRVIHAVLILMLGMMLLPAHQAASASPTINQADLIKPGELIVAFDQNLTAADMSARASALSGSISAQVLATRQNAVLLKLGDGADVFAAAEKVKSGSGVLFAEPNYIYRIPEASAVISGSLATDGTVRMLNPKTGSFTETQLAVKKAMRTKTGGRIKALYPNDTLYQWGWWWIGANIVWPDTTPSKNVCVIDTGVDYLHKDLVNRIIKGYDFVNADADPMDDDGHGTHVAGIIAANTNNAQGVAGISTGKVVAVKALDAQGKGSSWDISQAIRFCSDLTGASRADVINMSLGGVGYSQYLEQAVSYAKSKGKLLAVAAGNDNVFTYCPGLDMRSYPAGFADEGPNNINPFNCSSGPGVHPGYDNVLSVGAVDSNGNKASFSNYGAWVHWGAPGDNIVSTTPYDKPFYLNYAEGIDQRYASLSGTSMATPFLAAMAARAWGNLAVSNAAATYLDARTRLSDVSYNHSGGVNGWPAQQGSMDEPTVAGALLKGGIAARAWDANMGVPLIGAAISSFQYVSPTVSIPRSTAVMTSFTDSWVDIINLPAENWFKLKIFKTGFTSSPQDAFTSPDADAGYVFVPTGGWGGINGDVIAAVPAKTANFDSVTSWSDQDSWYNFDAVTYIPPVNSGNGPYIVAASTPPGNDFGNDEGFPLGSLSSYPYTRAQYIDERPWESHIIRARPGNAALPYYAGSYTFKLYDGNANGAHLSNYRMSFFLWKDGVIKVRANRASCLATDHYWNIGVLSSSSSAASFTLDNTCQASPMVYP